MVIYAHEFIENIKTYEKLIFSICLSFTKNYFDAEDLAQDTFLSAYKSLNRFDGNNFKAWITTIAVNNCKNYISNPKRKLRVISDEILENTPSYQYSPEESVVSNEQSKKIYKLCLKLKEPYKTVAIKYFCENIKLSEYAKLSGKNLKTLETQLYRAKKILAVLYEEGKYE